MNVLAGCTVDYDRYEASLTRFAGSELPVVVIDTDGLGIRDDPKISATLRMYEGGVAGPDDLAPEKASFTADVGIEVRGFTSQEFPKKQYGFELRDADGDDRSVALLGMPAAADWILSAPFMDKSLVRNHFGYGLARALGRYAPRTAFVELFLDDDVAQVIGPTQYRGVYVLTEKIERGRDRVAIEKLAPWATEEPDIAGGYLLEWMPSTRVKRDDRWFRTPGGATLVIAYPKPEDLTDAQQTWIARYVAAFEASVASPDGELGRYIDVDSFVDYFLLSELLRNHDVFTGSTFMHKTRDGKLAMGPLWDLDRTVGDVEFDGNWRIEGFLLPQRGWAVQLFERPTFVAAYRARWKALREGVLRTEAMLAMIDEAAMALGTAPRRNFEKWDVLGHYVKANRKPYAPTHEAEIAKIARWLSARAAWIDAHIDAL